MKQKHLSVMFAAIGLAVSGLSYAGVVTQYRFQNGGKGYEPLVDAVVLKKPGSTVVSSCYIFPKNEVVNAYKAPGFPIGFDFRYAGQTFNQFAVSPNGAILLGKDEVQFTGHSGLMLSSPAYGAENKFAILMSPIMGGVRKGGVSYKTDGEAGSRVLTVQFEKMYVDEPNVALPNQGAFSLQIRLYEADGRIEMAFREDINLWNDNGLTVGLRGWNLRDQIAVASAGLDSEPRVFASKTVELTDRSSYVRWLSNEDGDVTDVNYTFLPAENVPNTSKAPTGLTVTPSGRDLDVACVRGEGADGTLIVYSTSPFTSTDMPVSGISYCPPNSMGEMTGRVGEAVVLYNDTEEKPAATIPDIPANTTVYVRAYSMNGYPNYSEEAMAEATFVTTQNPPSNFISKSGSRGAQLSWSSLYPVILATTTEHPHLFKDKYVGVFGQPGADVAVGDEIPGGGKVIYVGEDSSMTLKVSDMVANRPNYYRIWNVKNGVVSSTASDALVVPEATLPYEPEVESWQIGLSPATWESNPENSGFVPNYREGDGEMALRGGSFNQVVTTLTTPLLPLTKPTTLKFEFSLETLRDPEKVEPDDSEESGGATGPSVEIPQGYEPGWFGKVDGAGLYVKVGPTGQETLLRTITEYDGTMTIFNEDKYKEGSSTFVPVEIEIPAQAERSKISFSFLTEKNSIMFLRKITVKDGIGAGIGDVAEKGGLKVTSSEGTVSFLSDIEREVEVFNLQGMRVALLNLEAGVGSSLSLPSGIYIAAGVKIVVK